jgi:hypothetical protein
MGRLRVIPLSLTALYAIHDAIRAALEFNPSADLARALAAVSAAIERRSA